VIFWVNPHKLYREFRALVVELERSCSSCEGMEKEGSSMKKKKTVNLHAKILAVS